MAPADFDPSEHPRDRKGRFTHSRTAPLSRVERGRAQRIAEAFKPTAGGKPSTGQSTSGNLSTWDSKSTDVNTSLRAGKESPEVAALDAAVGELDADVVLSRRVPVEAFGSVDPESLVGQKVRDAGFSEHRAGSVRANGDVRMIVAAPAGTRAVVDGDRVLLDRDTELAVAKVERNQAGGYDMHLVVLPKTSVPKVEQPSDDKAGDKPEAELSPEAQPQPAAEQLAPTPSPEPAPSTEQPAPRRQIPQDAPAPAVDAPARRQAWEQAHATSATGAAALDAVSTRLGPDGLEGWNDSRAPKAAEAIGVYQSQYYQEINAIMRGGHDGSPERMAQIDDIKTALDASPLREPIVVHRGFTDPRKVFGGAWNDHDVTGLTWQDDAFASTTADPRVAKKFAATSGGPVIMRMTVPAGTGAIRLSDMAPPDRRPSRVKHEAEVLLGPQQMRVVADHGLDERGVRMIDVEVIPAVASHDGETPGSRAAPATRVQAGDFSGLTRVGKQGGSNPGGIFEAEDGSRWYVKAQKSPEHAANEALASALYQEAGIDVPEVVRGAGAPGLPGDSQTASRIVDGATPDLGRRLGDEAYLSQVQAGFGVDAWLANWDTVGLGYDNVVTGSDGKPHRIDLGGSLLFRAQGDPKGAAFGDTVGEYESLRDPDLAPQASKVFGAMDDTALSASLERVEAVSPDRIRELAREKGLPELADRLIARREDLLGRRTPTPSPDSRPDESRPSGAALTEGEALDSVPVRLNGRDVEGAPAGWSEQERQQSAKAAWDYKREGLDRRVNEFLRGNRAGGPDVDETIEGLDRMMDASVLPEDVVAYRGVRSPQLIFGSAWNNTNVTGMEWDEAAYASTSVDPKVAEDFAGFGGTIMRVTFRKGSKAVRMSDMRDPSKVQTTTEREAEILGARGLRRRIVADHGFDASGRRIVDVEVVEG